jgi:putative transposase
VPSRSADDDPSEGERAVARFRLLRPFLEEGVPLAAVARAAGVPLRTAKRWVQRYRARGLDGLARRSRADKGSPRVLLPPVRELIEGLALRKPRRSVAGIARIVADAARERGWAAPSYAAVRAVVKDLDPALLVLAHQGGKAYADGFELLHRREAARPNEVWQADHTLLDVVVTDEAGGAARPWLTVVIDDHSRAVAGYGLAPTEPTALQTALVLRQAIWRKAEPGWPVCGIPEVLYTDHGRDFTSRHLERACAELKVRLVFSAVGKPRGRGRIERFFATVDQRFLPGLPGHAPPGFPAPEPSLSLRDLDAAFRRFLLDDYHQAPHGGTGVTPLARWRAGGFTPRMPASLEQLDLLLLTVARPRRVQRDGIRFQGLRYIDPTLAAFVGETVTIRHDPGDLAEVRVFRGDRFVCRAICPELAGETVGLKDIARARRERQRQLGQAIGARRSLVDQLLLARPAMKAAGAGPPPQRPAPARPRGLKRYENE